MTFEQRDCAQSHTPLRMRADSSLFARLMSVPSPLPNDSSVFCSEGGKSYANESYGNADRREECCAFRAAAPVTSPRVRLKPDRADRVGDADRRSGSAEFAVSAGRPSPRNLR